MKHAGLFITTMFLSAIALFLIVNVFITPNQTLLTWATIASGVANGMGFYTRKKMNEPSKPKTLPRLNRA